VFYRCKNAGSELVSVQLMQSICLPLLMYSVEALQPNKTTVNMFNHLIDRAVYKMLIMLISCTLDSRLTCLMWQNVLHLEKLELASLK